MASSHPRPQSDQAAEYHPCRWYDRNPRLSFAMRLLGIAPGSLKHQAIEQLQAWIEPQLGHHSLNELMHNFEQERLYSNITWNRRWYDDFENGPLLFEMLKKTPGQAKATMAETFLTMLKDVKSVNDER